MWRMKEPMQALHYLSLPATAGAILLTIAIFVSQGIAQAFWKVALIAGILVASNPSSPMRQPAPFVREKLDIGNRSMEIRWKSFARKRRHDLGSASDGDARHLAHEVSYGYPR